MCCFLLMDIIVVAQNFNSGITAGLTTSQVSGDDLSGFHKLGIHGGAYVNLRVADSSYLQMEMLFVQKGSQQGQDLEKGKAYYKMQLNYIEVPLLYQLKRKRFTYEIGASFGYLFRSKVSNIYGEYPDGTPESRPFNSTEISACAGINYKIYKHFSLGWRFSNSVLPIRAHYSGRTFRWNLGQYNSAMYLGLRYSFN